MLCSTVLSARNDSYVSDCRFLLFSSGDIVFAASCLRHCCTSLELKPYGKTNVVNGEVSLNQVTATNACDIIYTEPKL